MAAQNGRDLRIKWDGEVVAIVNTKTININNTPVDVTGDQNNGFITLLERPGTKQITCDVSGYTESDRLRDAAVTGEGLNRPAIIEWLSADGSGDVVYAVEGNFYLATFTETGASDGGLEFTANLQSSGEFNKVDIP